MSNHYKQSKDVPNTVLCKRLDELARAVTNGDDGIKREFSMRVPAELDHDSDLVLSEAADRIEKLDRIESVLKRYYELNGCYPGNKYWSQEFLTACTM